MTSIIYKMGNIGENVKIVAIKQTICNKPWYNICSFEHHYCFEYILLKYQNTNTSIEINKKYILNLYINVYNVNVIITIFAIIAYIL
jgi:hypothetical protein